MAHPGGAQYPLAIVTGPANAHKTLLRHPSNIKSGPRQIQLARADERRKLGMLPPKNTMLGWMGLTLIPTDTQESITPEQCCSYLVAAVVRKRRAALIAARNPLSILFICYPFALGQRPLHIVIYVLTL